MPTTITVVGLGYGDPESRTIAAQRALDSANRIVLRTAVHPGLDDLLGDSRVVACDDLYESCRSFVEVYRAVVKRVIELAADGDVVFAVPGSPAFGERTTTELAAVATARGHLVTFVPGVSALEAISQTANLDLLSDQIQLFDAAWISDQVSAEPFTRGTTGVDPTRPLVIAQVYSRAIASDVKHWLTRLYPEDDPVTIISAAGIYGECTIVVCKLCELDHHEVDHLTTVVVMPQEILEATASPSTLHHLIAHLRSERGCPWDKKQTHATLRDKVIEEAYEVADAINAGDPEAIAEELGDLLLLVALHAQIGEENGEFTIEDVYRHVNAKLVRRHPHVFGDAVAETADDVLTTWRGVKAQEKPQLETSESTHRFDQLPRSMPVIQRIRAAEGAESDTVTRSFEASGKLMLETVQQIIAQSIDPEAALEWAYRQQISNQDNVTD